MEKGGGPPETQRFVGEDPASLLRDALTEAESEGQRVLAVQTLQPTLEDVFVALTGLSAEQMEVDEEGKGT